MKSPAYASSCRIELLGGLKVKYATSIVTQFRTRKTATLLAYLALHPGDHTREMLVDLLWPECTLDAGRNSLNVSLNSLRSLFSSLYSSAPFLIQEGQAPTTQPFLKADRFTIGLNRDHVIVDAHQFERRLQNADLDENSPGALTILRQVLNTYDRVLPGYYEDWILSESQRLDELFFAALRTLLVRLRSMGEIHTAIVYARRGLALDETREDLQRDLMSLLRDSGQSVAAYRQFLSLKELLQRRYNASPDALTRQLARNIHNELQGNELLSNELGAFSPISSLPFESKASISEFENDNLPSLEDSATDIQSDVATSQIREVILAFFDNLSQRRACANLSFFLRPDATVVGVTRGGGTEIIWQQGADSFLDTLHRELINLATDTPHLVQTIQIQAVGSLAVAHISVVNPWILCEYIMVFTTEGGTPRITSITLETRLPDRYLQPSTASPDNN